MKKYRKAGIAIAALCIVLIFVVLGLHSCSKGNGVKLEQMNTQAQQTQTNTQTQQTQSTQQAQQSTQQLQQQTQQSSVQEYQPQQPTQPQQSSVQEYQSQQLTQEYQPEQTQQQTQPQTQQQTQPQQNQTQSEQPFEPSVKEYQIPEESSYVSESKVVEQATFIRINKDSIKYWYTDRTIQGTVVNTEVYYSKEESALYNAVIVKGEDSGVYRYFVSDSTFDKLRAGNIVSMTVRTYENSGQRITQVLSMTIVE